MSEELKSKILKFVQSPSYRYMKPRSLSHELGLDPQFKQFKAALRDLLDQGLLRLGKGTKILPASVAKAMDDIEAQGQRHSREEESDARQGRVPHRESADSSGEMAEDRDRVLHRPNYHAPGTDRPAKGAGKFAKPSAAQAKHPIAHAKPPVTKAAALADQPRPSAAQGKDPLAQANQHPAARVAHPNGPATGPSRRGEGSFAAVPADAIDVDDEADYVRPDLCEKVSAAEAEILPQGVVIGNYKQNKRGFGFVMPSNPVGHEDIFIAEEDNLAAMTGDIVKVRITGQSQRDGKIRYEGRITQIIKRTRSRFVGSLAKVRGQWVVLPDGNDFTQPILAPDAGSRHIKPGTKVVIELTSYPTGSTEAAGVITDVLGQAGEKDVDLRSVIVQHNLPEEFSDECRDQARAALDRFNATLSQEVRRRVDLQNEVICTIDPDDAKDYDDAISLVKLGNGNWELGVHIADVSFFVEPGSPLDVEAELRGNSVYFPGHVIPMLPEVLSNGVCSLQEGVPRLCKTAFIELNDQARPVKTRLANTVIKSARRLRYREAQAILDGVEKIPHPDGDKTLGDYPAPVIQLLMDMRALALRIQDRRNHDGQIVLTLPQVDLVLDEEGKVTGAVPEDQSFTHTLIEMFMVEANEAVARLLDRLDVPFLRRTHPEPEADTSERLKQFALVAGHRLPRVIDRKALQQLLVAVKGRPEAFAINLAVLRSMARAEYSPRVIGHYALASEHYAHFTSPIRRYADLTIHRLMDAYFDAKDRANSRGSSDHELVLEGIPSEKDLIDLGKRLSFTERRADDAENELRQVKILELLKDRVGEVFPGVVTGVAKFGVFVQLAEYLADGLVRYEDMEDDWWEVDERSGTVRGRRTGKRIAVGDIAQVIVVQVDVPRRELTLAIQSLRGREAQGILPVTSQGDASEASDASSNRPAGSGRPGAGGGHRGTKVQMVHKPRGKGGSAHRESASAASSAGSGGTSHRKGKPRAGGPAFGSAAGHPSGKPKPHKHGTPGATRRNQRSKKRGRGK